jgi:hypothetical protein
VLASLIASDTHIEHVRRVVARAKLEAGGLNDQAVELAMDMLVSLALRLGFSYSYDVSE